MGPGFLRKYLSALEEITFVHHNLISLSYGEELQKNQKNHVEEHTGTERHQK